MPEKSLMTTLPENPYNKCFKDAYKQDVEKVKKIMYEQNRNISKGRENLERSQKEILELGGTITEMKNSLEDS